ncbi:MAG: hypothetical protein K6347_08070 [Campylobacterales bacterium]
MPINISTLNHQILYSADQYLLSSGIIALNFTINPDLTGTFNKYSVSSSAMTLSSTSPAAFTINGDTISATYTPSIGVNQTTTMRAVAQANNYYLFEHNESINYISSKIYGGAGNITDLSQLTISRSFHRHGEIFS